MCFPNFTSKNFWSQGPNLQFICFAIDEVHQIFDAARFRALERGAEQQGLPSTKIAMEAMGIELIEIKKVSYI